MADVAQSVEHRIVAPGVVGSIPIIRPTFFYSPTGGGGIANVAKLADALVLGTSGVTRGGSSPSIRTKYLPPPIL